MVQVPRTCRPSGKQARNNRSAACIDIAKDLNPSFTIPVHSLRPRRLSPIGDSSTEGCRVTSDEPVVPMAVTVGLEQSVSPCGDILKETVWQTCKFCPWPVLDPRDARQDVLLAASCPEIVWQVKTRQGSSLCGSDPICLTSHPLF